LSSIAKKQCGITKDTLNDADSFELVFAQVIKWIKNLVRRANKFRNPENLPRKYFPGIIEYKVVILSRTHDHGVLVRAGTAKDARLSWVGLLSSCVKSFFH
jgi:hypothetical protein